MKKLTLIVTLLFSTVMFSSTSFAGWTKVMTANHVSDTYYVDFERIRKHGGFVYFWSLSDFLKPLMEEYLSERTYYQGDCGRFRYIYLSMTLYRGPMGAGTTNSSEGTIPKGIKGWRYPPPNSIEEAILKAVCRHAN